MRRFWIGNSANRRPCLLSSAGQVSVSHRLTLPGLRFDGLVLNGLTLNGLAAIACPSDPAMAGDVGHVEEVVGGETRTG